MNKLNNLIIETILEFISYCKFNCDDKDYKFLNKLYNKLNNHYNNTYNFNNIYEYMDCFRPVIFIYDAQISIFKNFITIYNEKERSICISNKNPYFNILKNKLYKIIELIKLKQLEDKKINQCIAICKTLIKNEFKRPFNITEDIMSCY